MPAPLPAPKEAQASSRSVAQRPWAIVTGASRGIGRACAWHLSRAGYRVVVCYGHQAGAARAVVEGIEAEQGIGAAIAHPLTLGGDADAIADSIQILLSTIGTPWALVHNAGVAHDGLFALSSHDNWHRVLEVNLMSFWAVMRPVTRALLKAREGRIVTMASVSGQRGNAGQCAYAASKAGLIGASKSLALELAPRGITVNAVAPGFINTDMTQALDAEAIVAHVPMRRLGQPDDVAAAVTFLCSQAAGYITGTVLDVNGGLYT